MKSFTFILIGSLFGLAQLVVAEPIPPGARVEVRSQATIDVHYADGRIYPGYVVNDVLAPDGRVVIPRGSPAELIVRRFGPHDFAIDLESVSVAGQRYSIDASDARIHRRDEGARTGAYTGGGAVVGSILGAIAGGGRGAAIGALAGGAAGASAAIATRGDRVFIPAESVLTFRTEQPLEIYPDSGYDRDGYHYHRDWDYGPQPAPPPPQSAPEYPAPPPPQQ